MPWSVSIIKQKNGGKLPATSEGCFGECIAEWDEGGYGGVGWLDNMVKAGKAIDLGGNGYPYRYTAIAEFIIPDIINLHPQALEIWTNEEFATALPRSSYRSETNYAALRNCRLSEWLLIEACDQS